MVMMVMEKEEPPEDMVIAPEVEIKASEVDTQRLGIWCKKKIEAGSKFGPFQGERVQVGTDDMDPSFVWEIVDLESKEFLFYINATNPKSGNWMRYINCARYFEEQNIVCEQEGMDIFYRAIKDIEPGEELLTWYEKTPFRKKRSKTRKSTRDEKADLPEAKEQSSDKAEVASKEDIEPKKSTSPVQVDEAGMHTSQRGRRRKVTKYWEMENFDNSEASDFQRESDMNSEDDMVIASDDDWPADTCSKPKEDEIKAEESVDGTKYFQFEVKPYHIVKSRLGRKVFKCEICSGVYRHSFSLKRHYIRNHINYAFVSRTDLLHCNIALDKVGNDPRDDGATSGEKVPEVLPNGDIAGNSNDSLSGAEDDGVKEAKEDCDGSVVRDEESNSNEENSIPGSSKECVQNPDSNHENEAEEDSKLQEKSEVNGELKEDSPAEEEAELVRTPDLFRCNVCEKLFDCITDLKAHLANHPESSSKAFACDKCDMKFTHKQNLMRHTAVHTVLGSKPLTCKFCGKKFSNLTNQKRHERAHMGRRLQCDLCPSTFTQSGDLKKHVRKLHPDNYYDCNYCARYFATADKLVDHVELAHADHHGNGLDPDVKQEEEEVKAGVADEDSRSHACKYCGKKFVTLTSRKRHERIHEGLRAQCEYCSSSFSQTPALKKHVRKHHPDKFHECSICSRYYPTSIVLAEHMRRSHHESDDIDQIFEMDMASDKAESMRLAYQQGNIKPQLKFACTVCKKKFGDYVSMCRHRSMAHHQQILQLSSLKKNQNSESPLRSLFDPDMEKNSAFYAKVAKNIADNLKYHLEGQSEHIKASQNLIKWKGQEAVVEKSAEKLELYNFPQGYTMKDGYELLMERVPLEDYIQDSGLGDEEKARAVVTEVPPNEVEVKGEDVEDSAALEPVADQPQAPPPGVATPEASEPSCSNMPCVSPPRILAIKVPDMKLCRICHSVFHSQELFKEHMLHHHHVHSDTNLPSPPPAHQHPPPLQILPPRWQPGVNPNLMQSLIIPPNTPPPPAHQNHPNLLSPGPPKLSPVPPHHIAPPLAPPTAPPILQPTTAIPSETSANGTPEPSEESKMPEKGLKPSQEPEPQVDSAEKPPEEEKKNPAEQVTGEDPNPTPKKHICLVCYDEFVSAEALKSHQEQKHSSVQCKGLAVDISFQATWFTRPSAVGLMNVTSCQLPTNSNDEKTLEKFTCTKCHKLFGSSNDLHMHILDCGDYGRNAPRLAYIWYLRGQVITPSKKGKKAGYGRRGRSLCHRKRKPGEGPQGAGEGGREEAQLQAQRKLLLERQTSLDSPEEEAEYGRRRRRRVQELFYNPNKHVRRRDLAELLGNKCFGCGQVFDIISMLERHIPLCPDKEKILGSNGANGAGKLSQVEADDSDNEYDPNKHMCIYCERYFTYLGMLRKHVVDTCTVRKELVENNEYLDEEWEAELDAKTGHAGSRRTLSRQSSVSSMTGIMEDGENSQDSFDNRPRRRRKRRGHNWGYKPKGGKKRSEEDEDGYPYMIEESFFADIDSSNSRVASIGEDESSNDSAALRNAQEAASVHVGETDSPAADEAPKVIKKEVKEEVVEEKQVVDEVKEERVKVTESSIAGKVESSAVKKAKALKNAALSSAKGKAKNKAVLKKSPKQMMKKGLEKTKKRKKDALGGKKVVSPGKKSPKTNAPSKKTKKVAGLINDDENDEDDVKLSTLKEKQALDEEGQGQEAEPSKKRLKKGPKTPKKKPLKGEKNDQAESKDGGGSTRKKRKSDEAEIGGEEATGKKQAKRPYNRSKSVPGTAAAKDLPKGRGGRKSDSSLLGNLQSKSAAGRGAGSRKSMG